MLERPAFTVQWLSPTQEAEWDAFVDAHEQGLAYHLSAWKKALEDSFPHISGRFLAVRNDSSGEIVAGLPIYRVRSWLLGNRLVSIPFASFCNPLVSGYGQLDLLLSELVQEYGRNGSDRLEVRMCGSARPFSSPPFCRIVRFRHNFLPLDRDPDELFHTLDKTSICQKVHKAQRAGVVIVEAGDEKSLKISHSILARLRQRLSLPAIPFSFFEAMRRHLWPRHMKLFLAFHKDKPVACHLVLTHKGIWTSEYSASTYNALHGVNQLLYWETIRRAMEAGAKVFSFGRTSVSNRGLLSYKRRWHTSEEDVIECVLKRSSALQRAPGGIVEMAGPRAKALFKLLLRNSPLAVNRLIGTYCYRHMG